MARVSIAARLSLRTTSLLDVELGREVRRGAERPAILERQQVDAAIGVEILQLLQQAVDVGAFGHAASQVLLVQGFGRGEQDGLEQPQ